MAQLAPLAEHCLAGLTLVFASRDVGRMKLFPLLIVLLTAASLRAGDPGMNAGQLASQMASLVEDGESSARVRMKASDGQVLQVQIKSLRSGGNARTVYEVLWPQQRKGEKVVLSQSKGGWPRGEKISAAGERSGIGRGEWSGGMFGTGLAYADVIENFFLWPKQELAGKESVGRADCVILESRPAGNSPHGKVRSWIDPDKRVVMRVEKYDVSGQLLRTITTTQVAKDDAGRNIPAGMTVTRPDGATTEIDGSNIRHDVRLTDADFAL